MRFVKHRGRGSKRGSHGGRCSADATALGLGLTVPWRLRNADLFRVRGVSAQGEAIAGWGARRRRCKTCWQAKPGSLIDTPDIAPGPLLRPRSVHETAPRERGFTVELPFRRRRAPDLPPNDTVERASCENGVIRRDFPDGVTEIPRAACVRGEIAEPLSPWRAAGQRDRAPQLL